MNNKKAEGYFQELVNATAHADADKIKALAIKLTAEFNTGEFANWKTWADLGLQATQVVGAYRDWETSFCFFRSEEHTSELQSLR